MREIIETSARELPAPVSGPQIKHVVQVDVGEEWRNHRPLARPLFTDCDDPVLQHARLEPFLDQANDAWIGNPMLDETDQPTLADFVERLLDRLPTTALIISTTIPIR